MKITKKWITDNKTPKGGWTKKQLQSIGVDWPPQKNWIEGVLNKEVTVEQQLIFENKI